MLEGKAQNMKPVMITLSVMSATVRAQNMKPVMITLKVMSASQSSKHETCNDYTESNVCQSKL